MLFPRKRTSPRLAVCFLFFLLSALIPPVPLLGQEPVFGPQRYYRSHDEPTVEITPSSVCEEMVYGGPWVFLRQTGKPRMEEVSFSVENPAADYVLHIINGEGDGSHRVSSARIWINGDQVAGPAAFNQQVAVIERDISLQEENLLEVKLSSSPGSFVTVSVRGDGVCGEGRGQFFIGYC